MKLLNCHGTIWLKSTGFRRVKWTAWKSVDDYFFENLKGSRVGPKMGIGKNPYAIIALGGYGRKEQFIHSDVDLLFIFEKYVPDKAEHLIQEIVYPLWDIGFKWVMPHDLLKNVLN